MLRWLVVVAMRQVLEESSDHHTVVRRKPDVEATVTKDFALGERTLVALSASVAVTAAPNAAQSSGIESH